MYGLIKKRATKQCTSCHLGQLLLWYPWLQIFLWTNHLHGEIFMSLKGECRAMITSSNIIEFPVQLRISGLIYMHLVTLELSRHLRRVLQHYSKMLIQCNGKPGDIYRYFDDIFVIFCLKYFDKSISHPLFQRTFWRIMAALEGGWLWYVNRFCRIYSL